MRNIIQSIEIPKELDSSLNSGERRKIVRVQCYLPVWLVAADGQPSPLRGVVTNVAVDGLKLKVFGYLPAVGEVLKIEPQSQLGPVENGASPIPIQCQIQWIEQRPREVLVGVRFSDSRENMIRSWVRYMLAELGFDEKCTFQRQRTAEGKGIPVRMIGGEPVQAGHPNQPTSCEGLIRNLGISGALVETRQEFQVGQEVALEMSLWRILPSLTLHGRVVEVRESHNQQSNFVSVQFGIIAGPQMKLLGNYVINQINQGVRSA